MSQNSPIYTNSNHLKYTIEGLEKTQQFTYVPGVNLANKAGHRKTHSATSDTDVQNVDPMANPLDAILAKVEYLLDAANGMTEADGEKADDIGDLISALDDLKAALTPFNKNGDGTDTTPGAMVGVGIAFTNLTNAFNNLPDSMKAELGSVVNINGIFDNNPGGNIPVSSQTILNLFNQAMTGNGSGGGTSSPTIIDGEPITTIEDLIRNQNKNISDINAILAKYGMSSNYVSTDITKGYDINAYNATMNAANNQNPPLSDEDLKALESASYQLYSDNVTMQNPAPPSQPDAYLIIGQDTTSYNDLISQLGISSTNPDLVLNPDLQQYPSADTISRMQQELNNINPPLSSQDLDKLTNYLTNIGNIAGKFQSEPLPSGGVMPFISSTMGQIDSYAVTSIMVNLQNSIDRSNTELDKITTDVATQSSKLNWLFQLMSALFAGYANTNNIVSKAL